jgi:hypothetical protein
MRARAFSQRRHHAAIMTSAYHLAQLNIGNLRYPRDAPGLRGYCEALRPVTAVALAWPGFIWIHDDSIIERAEQMFGAGMAANLSLWRDIESLRSFMVCPEHAAVMERRADWFVPMNEASFALWWVPAGSLPALNEGHERLMLLRRAGPTRRAFDLDNPFPPPSGVSRRSAGD